MTLILGLFKQTSGALIGNTPPTMCGILNFLTLSSIKLISSNIANQIRSLILKDDCVDTGCSLKVFDKEIFLSFPFFDGLHRFLPALFKGFGKNTLFINVDHRPRISGISKYGTFDRLYKGILDIIRVKKIIRNNKTK